MVWGRRKCFWLGLPEKDQEKKSRIICVPLVLSYEQKLISVNSLTNIAKFVRMKSNKIYILKLDSLSFLTLITKLQIHLAFGILQNTPAIIPQKIAQVIQRDPIMTKLFERDGQVAKQFERPDVSNEWMAKLFEQYDVSNEWVTKSFKWPDFSNEWVTKSFERADGCNKRVTKLFERVYVWNERVAKLFKRADGLNEQVIKLFEWLTNGL